MSTGIKGQFGLVAESTYGTLVTVTEFFPVEAFSIKESVDRIEDDTVVSGRRVMKSTQWGSGASTVAGSVNTLLWTTATRTVLEHMFGGETGVGPYTYIPTDLEGQSTTMQGGIPGTGGTVHPFTWGGCKVGSWEIRASEGNSVTLALDVMGQTQATGTALATASYGDLVPFRFQQASITIAAASYKVESLRLAGNNGLVERRFNGQVTTEEPLEGEKRTYAGSFTGEFIDLTQMNRFINGTEAALVSTFTDGANSLVITSNVRFDGETPSLNGNGIVPLDVPFKCVSDTSDAAAITAVLTLA
jgi:hypothetical protein